MLITPSFDELIKVNHQVRIIYEVLNKIDIQPMV